MGRKKVKDLPLFHELIKPLVKALIALGGSGSIEELNGKVFEIAKLTNEQVTIPHGDDHRTEIEYRLAWARTYLKGYGLLENSSRGIWSLTKPNLNPDSIDTEEVRKVYRALAKSKKKSKKEDKE